MLQGRVGGWCGVGRVWRKGRVCGCEECVEPAMLCVFGMMMGMLLCVGGMSCAVG